tara:strand:- start:3083 stop:4054 length:972 start_codon:yes stop_codon:yes gene_type:complete
MIDVNENLKITPPQNQLHLYGYDNHFNNFVNLFKKGKLPNTILLSGPKGSGKSTFVYHFVNYLLSYNEENKYSIDNYSISSDNKSYKTLCNYTNPNFSLLENDPLDENIKIDKVRNILKFLSKTTYSSNIKIVLIDNAEYLNLHSSNALLKVLEESSKDTFFFIVHNNASKILDTIKSRCIEFKFFFTISEKKKILDNITKQYNNDLDMKNIDDSFYFETPGNILKYLTLFNENNLNFLDDKLSCIIYLIDKYKQKKDTQLLTLISLLVELFYNELSLKNSKNSNFYSANKINLVNQINDAKKFNLDKKNLFISLVEKLKNES